MHDPTRPTAVVVLGSGHTEATDFLAPFELLASSGASNVYAVAGGHDEEGGHLPDLRVVLGQGVVWKHVDLPGEEGERSAIRTSRKQ